MIKLNKLFEQKLEVVNIGLESFSKSVEEQKTKVVNLSWRPPYGGNLELMKIMEKLDFDKIDEANSLALNIINSGEPKLVGVKFANEVIEGMDKFTIGHAGPPLEWKDMCGPLKGAILGAIIYEGNATTLEEAQKLIDLDKIKFVSNHSMGCVGPMTGIITYSMPLWEVENTKYGNYAYCTFNEGLGKVMRFGANDESVINRLKWIENTLSKVIKKAVELSGPIELKVIMSKALSMGDEMHQRNIAASSLIARELMPFIVKVSENKSDLYDITKFITGNDQFFLNLAMAAAKSITDPAKNIKNSTVVTTMSRNGTNFGIKISALGETWFEAPVNQPEGLYFPGYNEKDANPDIGDSSIVETIGIGGFAMGSAPAVVRFVGAKSVKEALQYSKDMQEICVGLSTHFIIPTMDFVGVATAIDAKKVIEKNILPVINTGMAHKNPGIGQVGAGIVKAPEQCFIKAMKAFVKL